MAYRETTVTVFGTAQVIRTEQTGTVRQLETAHTKAVKAALEAAYAAGKPAALAAAKAAAAKADAKAAGHASAPLLVAAHDAHKTVKRIEKRKFATPTYRKAADMARPFPAVKFDADPTDPRFADYYRPLDTSTAPTAPVVAPDPKPVGDVPQDAAGFLAWILAPYAGATA